MTPFAPSGSGAVADCTTSPGGAGNLHFAAMLSVWVTSPSGCSSTPAGNETEASRMYKKAPTTGTLMAFPASTPISAFESPVRFSSSTGKPCSASRSGPISHRPRLKTHRQPVGVTHGVSAVCHALYSSPREHSVIACVSSARRPALRATRAANMAMVSHFRALMKAIQPRRCVVSGRGCPKPNLARTRQCVRIHPSGSGFCGLLNFSSNRACSDRTSGSESSIMYSCAGTSDARCIFSSSLAHSERGRRSFAFFV
mmetsp:Transcript_71129/g.197588  ORF Transcript_71129/g.197588 Transcript_71129/m.197588 type:complete len:256 (+) Transcript_71129:743-1510(+)